MAFIVVSKLIIQLHMQKKSIIISVIIVAIIGAYFIFASMSSNQESVVEGQETEVVQEVGAEGAAVEGAETPADAAAAPVQETAAVEAAAPVAAAPAAK